MSLKVDVIKPAIGVKVYMDRAAIQQPETAQQLLQLLDRHTVLVFPEIGLSDAEQLALTDALGKRVNIHARIAGRENADAVYQVTLNEGASIEKEYVLGTFFWHMDGLTIDIPPPKATVLSARRLSVTGGQTEFDVEANTVRRMIAELERRYPGLGHQIDEGMAIAIDGEIFQDAYLEKLKPDSEVVLIPKIGGG